jgi:hypothetical protein
MKPSLSRPASRNKPPQNRTSAAPAVVYSAADAGEISATDEASSTAAADVAATTR